MPPTWPHDRRQASHPPPAIRSARAWQHSYNLTALTASHVGSDLPVRTTLGEMLANDRPLIGPMADRRQCRVVECQIRDTSDLEIPASTPRAATNWSTDPVVGQRLVGIAMASEMMSAVS